MNIHASQQLEVHQGYSMGFDFPDGQRLRHCPVHTPADLSMASVPVADLPKEQQAILAVGHGQITRCNIWRYIKLTSWELLCLLAKNGIGWPWNNFFVLLAVVNQQK